MEASAGAQPTDTPRTPSFLERLRGFALGVEERITPSEIQDVVSGVIALLDHHGLDIPEPEPSADEQAAADEQRLRDQNAELQAELERLRAGGTAEPVPAASSSTDPTGPATDPTAPQVGSPDPLAPPATGAPSP